MTQQYSSPELAAVADFLSQCLPFNALPLEEFNSVVAQLEVIYYRRGHILTAESPDNGLRILRSGAVEIRGDQDQLLDRLAEYESFNIAGLNQGQPGTRAILIEDSLIYLLREEHYQHLRQRRREVDRFFHSQRDRRLRRAARYEPYPNAMMRSLATLMSRDVLALLPGDSIMKAANVMTERRVSSALVIENDRLCGIITDRDLRSRALAKALDPNTPTKEVMTPNPQGITSDATVFDATLLMTRCGYHHLPVMEQDKVVGIITASDLMLARQDDPVYLVQHISRQTTIDGMRTIVQSMSNMLVEWVHAGMRADQVSHILTAISDAVTARLIELAIEELGPSPVPFCWLGFGSQGRSEQLIGADQDNGLLISDQMSAVDKPWFEQLAHTVCDGLNSCGYVYCSGKVMATTEQWRQSLAGWQRTVDRWTDGPTPEAVMHVSIFFDLRTVYGDDTLCRQLQQHMLARTSHSSIFLAALAENVLQHTPPLGIFRRFLVERNGEHRDTLDLKKRGVIPIIDIMRIHALANSVTAVNTKERITELSRIKALTIADSRNLCDAFDFIMQLRVQAQAQQLARGGKASNYYNPKDLPEIGRKHLRDAFTVVHDSQESLRHTFRRGL